MLLYEALIYLKLSCIQITKKIGIGEELLFNMSEVLLAVAEPKPETCQGTTRAHVLLIIIYPYIFRSFYCHVRQSKTIQYLYSL